MPRGDGLFAQTVPCVAEYPAHRKQLKGRKSSRKKLKCANGSNQGKNATSAPIVKGSCQPSKARMTEGSCLDNDNKRCSPILEGDPSVLEGFSPPIHLPLRRGGKEPQPKQLLSTQ